jgi:tRNA 2-selenouridine synthase
MSTWNDPELTDLFSKKTPLIDVRAPIEFQEGIIPNSINLPIMNDEERRLVGTCYKEHGQEAAIELGHTLVSGPVKQERIELWKSFLDQNPEAEIFCFRGGLRSQIACQWISETGHLKKPIPGGQKRIRRYFLSWLEDAPLPPLRRIGGLTGSGKTRVLSQVKHHIDLEELAHHRGSAFGPRGNQPAQITFENNLALELMQLSEKTITFEDESVTLGKLVIPRRIFYALRASPLIILKVDPYERLNNIFEDFVKNSTPEFFFTGLQKIEKKLGASKIKMLSEQIVKAYQNPLEVSHHESWIMTLLSEYYDPLYQKDLRYNRDKVVFEGNSQEILAFLEHP